MDCGGFKSILKDSNDSLSGVALRWTHICELDDSLRCVGEPLRIGTERTPPESTPLPGFLKIQFSDSVQDVLVYTRVWEQAGKPLGVDVMRLDLARGLDFRVPLAFGSTAVDIMPIYFVPEYARYIAPVEVRDSTGSFSSGEGGQVGDVSISSAEVEAPPGSVSEPVNIQIQSEDRSDADTEAAKLEDEEARGLNPVGVIVEINATAESSGLAVTQFDRPLRITLAYDPALVLDFSVLGVFYWDVARQTWQKISAETVDPVAHTITVEVDHLTTFGVFTLQPAIINSVSFGEVFAYPNPATQGSVIIHVEAPGAQRVEFRFYNLMGRLIHKAEMSGAPSAGINGAQAYEYKWDLGGIASGVYAYVIRAERSGQAIHILKKLAVVK